MNEHLIIRAADLLGIEIKPEVMVILLEKLAISLGINDEPAKPKEQPEPKFATRWDDIAIESIVEKCLSYILEDFDSSRLPNNCPSWSRDYILRKDIVKVVNGVLLGNSEGRCVILNRFERSVIRSIAVAHRDYDHWNESNELK